MRAGYDDLERWRVDARRAHESKVKAQKKLEFLRREQGLE